MTERLDPPQTLTVQRLIPGTPHAAYRAWTDPAALERWFGPPGYRARVLVQEPQPGGRWRFRMEHDDGRTFHHYGTYVELDPPHRLVFTWASEEPVAGWRADTGAPSRVTVTFARQGDQVLVTITHEGLPTQPLRQSLRLGWSGGLERLQLQDDSRNG